MLFNTVKQLLVISYKNSTDSDFFPKPPYRKTEAQTSYRASTPELRAFLTEDGFLLSQRLGFKISFSVYCSTTSDRRSMFFFFNTFPDFPDARAITKERERVIKVKRRNSLL